MTREEISNFLIGQKDNAKEAVLANFASYVITQGISVDKLGKLITDLRSYKEWKWGE